MSTPSKHSLSYIHGVHDVPDLSPQQQRRGSKGSRRRIGSAKRTSGSAKKRTGRRGKGTETEEDRRRPLSAAPRLQSSEARTQESRAQLIRDGAVVSPAVYGNRLVAHRAHQEKLNRQEEAVQYERHLLSFYPSQVLEEQRVYLRKGVTVADEAQGDDTSSSSTHLHHPTQEPQAPRVNLKGLARPLSASPRARFQVQAGLRARGLKMALLDQQEVLEQAKKRQQMEAQVELEKLEQMNEHLKEVHRQRVADMERAKQQLANRGYAAYEELLEEEQRREEEAKRSVAQLQRGRMEDALDEDKQELRVPWLSNLGVPVDPSEWEDRHSQLTHMWNTYWKEQQALQASGQTATDEEKEAYPTQMLQSRLGVQLLRQWYHDMCHGIISSAPGLSERQVDAMEGTHGSEGWVSTLLQAHLDATLVDKGHADNDEGNDATWAQRQKSLFARLMDVQQLCFKEVCSQVSRQSHDRGELLQLLWDQQSQVARQLMERMVDSHAVQHNMKQMAQREKKVGDERLQTIRHFVRQLEGKKAQHELFRRNAEEYQNLLRQDVQVLKQHVVQLEKRLALFEEGVDNLKAIQISSLSGERGSSARRSRRGSVSSPSRSRSSTLMSGGNTRERRLQLDAARQAAKASSSISIGDEPVYSAEELQRELEDALRYHTFAPNRLALDTYLDGDSSHDDSDEEGAASENEKEEQEEDDDEEEGVNGNVSRSRAVLKTAHAQAMEVVHENRKRRAVDEQDLDEWTRRNAVEHIMQVGQEHGTTQQQGGGNEAGNRVAPGEALDDLHTLELIFDHDQRRYRQQWKTKLESVESTLREQVRAMELQDMLRQDNRKEAECQTQTDVGEVGVQTEHQLEFGAGGSSVVNAMSSSVKDKSKGTGRAHKGKTKRGRSRANNQLLAPTSSTESTASSSSSSSSSRSPSPTGGRAINSLKRRNRGSRFSLHSSASSPSLLAAAASAEAEESREGAGDEDDDDGARDNTRDGVFEFEEESLDDAFHLGLLRVHAEENGRVRTLPWLLRFLRQFYSSLLGMDAADSQLTETVVHLKMRPVSIACYEHLLRMYGLKTVAEDVLTDIVCTSVSYAKRSARVDMFCRLTGILGGKPLSLDSQALYFRLLPMVYPKPPLLELYDDAVTLTRALAIVGEVFSGSHDIVQQLSSRLLVLSERLAKEQEAQQLRLEREAEAVSERGGAALATLRNASKVTMGSTAMAKVMGGRAVRMLRDTAKASSSPALRGGRGELLESSVGRRSSAQVSGSSSSSSSNSSSSSRNGSGTGGHAVQGKAHVDIQVDMFLQIVLEEWHEDNRRFQDMVRMMFKSDNLGEEKVLPLDEYRHIVELADPNREEADVVRMYRRTLMESGLRYPHLPNGVIVCEVMVKVAGESRRSMWLHKLQSQDIRLVGATERTSLYDVNEKFELLEESWNDSQSSVKETLRRLREAMTDISDFQAKRRKLLEIMEKREGADEAWTLYRSFLGELTSELQKLQRIRRFQAAANKVVALTRMNLMAKKTAKKKKLMERLDDDDAL